MLQVLDAYEDVAGSSALCVNVALVGCRGIQQSFTWSAFSSFAG